MAYLPGSARLARDVRHGTRRVGQSRATSTAPRRERQVALIDGTGIVIGAGPGGTTTLAVFLGDVINSDNDANAEQYTLEYRAVVQNVAGNQAGTDAHQRRHRVSYWNALSQTQTLTPVTHDAHGRRTGDYA